LSGRRLSLPPEGGGIIRSKIFRALRFGKSGLIKALVELSPKRSEVGFAPPNYAEVHTRDFNVLYQLI